MITNYEEKFISGIYNYCDRWCERCIFTARCRVADAESDLTDEERDMNNEAFWRRLAANFIEAKRIIIEKAEEFNIDLDAVSDKEFAAVRQRQNEFIKVEVLSDLTRKYGKDAGNVLEKKDDWLIFSATDGETQNEILEIIYRYQHFIAAKIYRGLQGLLDVDGNFDESESDDNESDANGSIKIALIAIERSIIAWTAFDDGRKCSNI